MLAPGTTIPEVYLGLVVGYRACLDIQKGSYMVPFTILTRPNLPGSVIVERQVLDTFR